MAKHVAATVALVVIASAVAYGAGAYSYARNLWPMPLLREWKADLAGSRLAPHAGGELDALGRLTAYPGKESVPCPAQDPGTGVILVIGQSNAANHAEALVQTRYPQQVFNQYRGACFTAASPLLGATGTHGEFITLLADQLVERGVYAQVVIIAAAVGDSPISRWQAGGDLQEMLLEDLRLSRPYRVTDIVWHQGETDFRLRTSAAVYGASFKSMRESLRSNGVDAPMFIAVATRCGFGRGWTRDNATANGQRQLVDGEGVFLAVDSDALLAPGDRDPRDGCHLAASGQQKMAAAYASAIAGVRGAAVTNPN